MNIEEEMLECPLCGQKISPSTAIDAHMDGEVVYICQHCLPQTAVCEVCGERHLRSELRATEEMGWICEECVENSDKYICCEHCGRYAPRDSAVIYDDEWWGERCANNYLVRCEDCGSWIKRDDSIRCANGDWICQSCYELDYVTCDGCGNVILSDNATVRNDCYYCENCAPSSGIYEYHGFNTSNYRDKKKIDGEKDDLYLGIELECDYGRFDRDDFSDYDEIHFEEDGSLSSDGIEMISLPMTLRYHQRYDWERILSLLLNQEFKSHDTPECGLHVHMSRWAIPATTIAKMDVFINRANEFWKCIARRGYVYNGEYNSEKRLDFTRCLYATSSRCPDKMIDKFSYGLSYDRYTPVNVCNRSTVEIRIFRGTLKYQTLMGTIEICHALVNWLNTVPVTRIYDTEKLIREFIEYIKHNKDRYPNVMPMLELRFAGTRFDRLVKQNAVEKISQ